MVDLNISGALNEVEGIQILRSRHLHFEMQVLYTINILLKCIPS